MLVVLFRVVGRWVESVVTRGLEQCVVMEARMSSIIDAEAMLQLSPDVRTGRSDQAPDAR